MRASRKRLVGASVLGLVASGLLLTPTTAVAAGPGLVISEVYGGGGNTGAVYTHDFIELHNSSTLAVPLGGKSLQYRSATSTVPSTNIVVLPAVTLPPGARFLVQAASGGNVGSALPAADATTGINMSGTAGQLFLAQQTAAVTVGTNPVANPAIIDFLGYGANAAVSETAPAPATSNVTASSRDGASTDTDNNSVDFKALAPAPQACGTVCAASPPPPPPEPEPEPAPVAKTIAEIQGTGAESPIKGQTVVTTGVVTAAYPTGGFDGFYIQTGGGDATPGASDGLFVYAPSFTASYPAVGESVQVTGKVSEFGGMTQVTAASAGAVTRTAALPALEPRRVVPGTDCALPGTGCLGGADLEGAREAHEGEAFQPTASYTVTDAYDGSAFNGGPSSSGMFGEVGLAASSTEPLVTPTEVIDAQDTVAVAQRTAYNTAHRVILDDGASINYASASNKSMPFPWLTRDHTVRVGAAVTFPAPVVLDHRFGWKLQPQRQVVGAPVGLVTFEQDRPALPEDVGGDLKIATFNVLNYFTTLGTDRVGCSSHNDRAGEPVTVRDCGFNGPRGAWDAGDFERQQAKIVDSINKLDADVVSLEEIENSLTVDGHDRDEATAALVRALNAAAGSTRWDYVRSPDRVPASEDVIRTSFIFDPSTVQPLGPSEILVDDPAFQSARDPFAQAFYPAGRSQDLGFVVVANHFKSKRSGTADGFGQGSGNAERVQQSEALLEFADEYAAARGVAKIFLAGDFNAYTEEDPIQVLEAAGYTSLHSTTDPEEESYSFDGAIGSLDHILANEAALPSVTGVDVWTTNSYESIYYEYSRHNSNITDLYAPDPFRASDHNPEIVGIDVPDVTAVTTSAVRAVYGTPGVIDVTVTPAAATGTVEVLDGTRSLGTATLSGGKARLSVPGTALRPGTYPLTVSYSGDARHESSSTTVTYTVSEADSTTTARSEPTHRKGSAGVEVVVSAVGVVPTGDVVALQDGQVVAGGRLVDGRATLLVGPFQKAGSYELEIRYLGDELVEESATAHVVRVVQRKDKD